MIVGGIADGLVMDMRAAIASAADASPPNAAVRPVEPIAAPASSETLPAAWLAVLGGAPNLATVLRRPGRLRMTLVDAAGIAEGALAAMVGVAAVVRPSTDTVHLVIPHTT